MTLLQSDRKAVHSSKQPVHGIPSGLEPHHSALLAFDVLHKGTQSAATVPTATGADINLFLMLRAGKVLI